jgi:(E)-4-hydroxy-3-methylbut-2-enyl-diphosphate synthase
LEESNHAMRPNERTHRVMVGSVPVGGGAPVAVQSMLNVPAADAAGNLAQIERLAAAGCEIVRMAVPHPADLDAFERVCAESPLPVVADIHFDADIAVAAAKRGAAALRINPGNIGGLARTDAVLDAAGQAGIPIRIGVNAGSLDQALKDRTDLSLPEKLAASAVEYAGYCKERGFEDLVVSAKAHDVMTTVRTYRLLSEAIPTVPLHIGVTEAGTQFQGTMKSACGLGILLEEGIGDTMRISLTDDPGAPRSAPAWTLLSALGLRRAFARNRELPHVRPHQVGPHRFAPRGRRRALSVKKPPAEGGGDGLRRERSRRSCRRRHRRRLRQGLGRRVRQDGQTSCARCR